MKFFVVVVILFVAFVIFINRYSYLQKKRQAMDSLRKYMEWLGNADMNSMALDNFKMAKKAFEQYRLNKPEEEGYPSIDKIHEKAMEAMSDYVKLLETSHQHLKIELDKLPEPEEGMSLSVLVDRAWNSRKVNNAWAEVEEARSKLDTLSSLRSAAPGR